DSILEDHEESAGEPDLPCSPSSTTLMPSTDGIEPPGPAGETRLLDGQAATESFRSGPPESSRGRAALPVIPGYEILQTLGRGGMGVVYLATQRALKRPVALKMIRAQRDVEPDQLVRFRVEAEAVARLRHPHVVQIYEVGDVDGAPYFSLELLEGGTLAER